MLEYINPNNYEVRLIGQNNQVITVGPRSRIILSEYFQRYTPTYLRIIGATNTSPTVLRTGIPYAYSINPSLQQHTPIRPAPPTIHPQVISKPVRSAEQVKPSVVAPQQPQLPQQQNIDPSIVGIGILSYNRLHTIKRLIESIRKYADLSRLKVIVSDESSEVWVKNWLSEQRDIILLTNQPRIGIAGNTNRLIRYLAKFQYCLLLNDDVEILKTGWESLYPNACIATGINHFCFRQPGLYGATTRDGSQKNIGQYTISTIGHKPQGAVMFYTNELYRKIGYFDESFGFYGMEHVDWSTRATRSGLVPVGFHDVVGSNTYFKIHHESSAVSERSNNLSVAKSYYNNISRDNSRLFIQPSDRSNISI